MFTLLFYNLNLDRINRADLDAHITGRAFIIACSAQNIITIDSGIHFLQSFFFRQDSINIKHEHGTNLEAFLAEKRHGASGMVDSDFREFP